MESTPGLIGVLGMGTYIPPNEITNERVAQTTGVTEEWIIRATGIRARYAAAEDEAASDLGLQALRLALAAADVDPEQLDLIIMATSTPDELGPATACRVQHKIKAHAAVAFDINAACSGWLFGASTVQGWFATHPRARYAAVITVDTYTKFLDMSDRSTAVLFSDGAVATILGKVTSGGIHDIFLGSDGATADSIMIPAGGSRMPVVPGNTGTLQQIHMDGRAIRDFAYKVVPHTVKGVLSRNSMAMEDIDLVVAHQPNPVLLTRLAERSGIPQDKLVITGDEVGNIGCACTPYALSSAASRGMIEEGSRVLVVAFGAGMTWGGALMTWNGAPAVRMGSTTTE